MSGPNRKVVLEVLGDGSILISANFDENGSARKMQAVCAYDGVRAAIKAVEDMLYEYSLGFMSGDGTVPLKPSWQRMQPGPDDIPF